MRQFVDTIPTINKYFVRKHSKKTTYLIFLHYNIVIVVHIILIFIQLLCTKSDDKKIL
jgi:hypothetical protein